MAYERVYDRWSTTYLFVADSDSDVSDVETNETDAPVGSIVIASNSGSPKWYMKFPAGTFDAIT